MSFRVDSRPGLARLDVTLDPSYGGQGLLESTASFELELADGLHFALAGQDIPNLLLKLWSKRLNLKFYHGIRN